MSYTVHTVETAPEATREALAGAKKIHLYAYDWSLNEPKAP